MASKVISMKFHNAIRVGTTQHTYIDQNSKINAEISGNIVRVTDDKGNVAYTSLYNVPYWTIEEKKSEQTRNTSTNKGGRAKKSK